MEVMRDLELDYRILGDLDSLKDKPHAIHNQYKNTIQLNLSEKLKHETNQKM